MSDPDSGRPPALDYEARPRPASPRHYHTAAAMVLAIVGLAAGALFTIVMARTAYEHIWGDADVGGPCIAVLGWVGPFILLGSAYNLWMVVRARHGKSTFTPAEARAIFNRDGWTGLRDALRGSDAA